MVWFIEDLDDGVEATTLAEWHSIGGGGLNGHVCGDCASAIESAGAIGSSAVGRAALAFVSSGISLRKGKRLRTLLDEGLRLQAWGALPPPRVPNSEPWGHLRSKVIDRL